MDTKLKAPSKTVLQANTNAEQLSLPREGIVADRIQISTDWREDGNSLL